ncbi:unnamed protein product [Sphagnum balticum]
MFGRIEEVSQESSPSNDCTRNLLELFERELYRQPTNHRSSTKKTQLSELEESMIRDEETRVFMEAMFPDFETSSRVIPLKEFINKALLYFFPEERLSK